MANSDHVSRLDWGKERFNKWRESHNGDQLDFTQANLNGRNLEGYNLSKCNISRASLIGANLIGANLEEANIDYADLTEANLTRANASRSVCSRANCSSATLIEVIFGEARIEHVKFEHANLTGAKLDNAKAGGAVFSGAKLGGASAQSAFLAEAKFIGADCRGVNFGRAVLQHADLSNSNIEGADFLESEVGGANFLNVNHAPASNNLARSNPHSQIYGEPIYFETCKRHLLWDRICSWETIRALGRMQLFGVSYFLLIFLVTSFYAIGQYNEKLAAVRTWTETVEEKGNPISRATAAKLHDKLQPFKIGKSSILLLVSTLMLVGASILYACFCPAEVKDFSSAEWQYAHGKPLIHYWPLCWSWPLARYFCMGLYAIGGTMAGGVTLWKIGFAIIYAWQFVG